MRESNEAENVITQIANEINNHLNEVQIPSTYNGIIAKEICEKLKKMLSADNIENKTPEEKFDAINQTINNVINDYSLNATAADAVKNFDVLQRITEHTKELGAQIAVDKIKQDIHKYKGELEKRPHKPLDFSDKRTEKLRSYTYLNDILNNEPHTLRGSKYEGNPMTAVQKIERIQDYLNSESAKKMLKKDSDGDFVGFFNSVGRHIKAAAYKIVGKEASFKSQAATTVKNIEKDIANYNTPRQGK